MPLRLGLRLPEGPWIGPASRGWLYAEREARSRRSRPDLLQLLSGLAALGDLGAVIAGSFIAYACQHGAWREPVEALAATLLTAGLFTAAMRCLGGYQVSPRIPLAAEIGRTALAGSCAFAAVAVLTWVSASRPVYWSGWILGWCGYSLAASVAVRATILARGRSWMRSGRLARVVAVVDMNGDGPSLAAQLRAHAHGSILLLGVFRLAGGGVSDLIGLARRFRIDDIMVASTGGEPGLPGLLRELSCVPANIHVRAAWLPTMPGARTDAWSPSSVLTLQRRPLTGWGRLIKRAEDLVLASVILILLLPLMVLLWAAVRLDSPGPALFRQKRHGFNNNEFEVLKFRTMFHREGSRDVRQASRDDPRVTRVGRFLRRTSLDELPQLFNVIRGDMSLIGPRPHALEHNDYYAALIDGYLARHKVQPGITGLAQVNGFRGETERLDKMRRRVEYDLAYIENWSLLLDLKILVRTACSFLGASNAY